MATVTDRLNEWLRDAHATEKQAAIMMSGTADRNDDYPEFCSHMKEQSEIAKMHAETLERCLENRGESPSALKDMSGKITAMGQTLSGLVTGDEVVKAALAAATFARMEAASYRILVAAAEQAGDDSTKRTCEALLQDEERFADWLDEHMPTLTGQYLQRETTAH